MIDWLIGATLNNIPIYSNIYLIAQSYPQIYAVSTLAIPACAIASSPICALSCRGSCDHGDIFTVIYMFSEFEMWRYTTKNMQISNNDT